MKKRTVFSVFSVAFLSTAQSSQCRNRSARYAARRSTRGANLEAKGRGSEVVWRGSKDFPKVQKRKRWENSMILEDFDTAILVKTVWWLYYTRIESFAFEFPRQRLCVEASALGRPNWLSSARAALYFVHVISLTDNTFLFIWSFISLLEHCVSTQEVKQSGTERATPTRSKPINMIQYDRF